MDDALRGFLEDHFDKLETSIVRLYDKLDVISKETNGNTKDIANLKVTMDDKLKGFRIGHEGCQLSCKAFREKMEEDFKEKIDENKKEFSFKIQASEIKMKNWLMGLAISGGLVLIGFAVTTAIKIWGK